MSSPTICKALVLELSCRCSGGCATSRSSSVSVSSSLPPTFDSAAARRVECSCTGLRSAAFCEGVLMLPVEFGSAYLYTYLPKSWAPKRERAVTPTPAASPRQLLLRPRDDLLTDTQPMNYTHLKQEKTKFDRMTIGCPFLQYKHAMHSTSSSPRLQQQLSDHTELLSAAFRHCNNTLTALRRSTR